PARMALVTAAAMLFLRGDLSSVPLSHRVLAIPAESGDAAPVSASSKPASVFFEPYVPQTPTGQIVALVARYGNDFGWLGGSLGLSYDGMVYPVVAVNFEKGKGGVGIKAVSLMPAHSSDEVDSAVRWNRIPSEQALFYAQSRKTLALVGFAGG